MGKRNLSRGAARFGAAALVSLALFGLSGCENSKDKAARHLASALELAEKGDKDRALVEFRNVFKLDPENIEARRSFAAFLEGKGDLAGAYAQYQGVIDRKPDDQEAIRKAAGLAARIGNWPEAGRQADALLALVPNDPEMTAIKIATDYAGAASKGDAPGRAKAAEAAKAMLATRPDDFVLHRVVIDSLAQAGDLPAALTATEAALKLFPEEKALWALKVSLLAGTGDKAGVEATLKSMESDLKDASAGEMLLRWYMSEGQSDKAEAWLREKSAQEGEKGMQARVQLALFLKSQGKVDQAMAELDAALKLNPPANTDKIGPEAPVTALALQVLRASILFDAGKRDEAITTLKDVLATEGLQASDQTRMTKVTLARMLTSTGDQVQARALVEEVLTEDAGQVEASKMKAAWLIDEDKTDEAVALLRAALEAAPRDYQAMTILSEAYARAGNRELQADMLARAVEASGKAPPETLRYANLLANQEKYLPAESLLVDALRLQPDNLDLLAAMGDLYIRMKDWPRAEGVAARLDDIGSDGAKQISARLHPAILAGRDDRGAAVDYLKGLAETSGALGDKIALISAYLADGKTAEAKALATETFAADPKTPQARFVTAAIQAAEGNGTGAMTELKALVDENPTALQAWVALIRQAVRLNGPTAATPLIEEALVKMPDNPDLLFMKAGQLELAQDIDGAIAIYDKLYAMNSSNLVVANNLASLLSSYKSDQASLDKAWAVARRLNGTQVPAFADTYGWLAHLRGDAAEALPYLETAAKALTDDPLVQFHYAEGLKAAGRAEEAKAQYAKVAAMLPADDTRAFAQTARKESTAAAPAP